jgi:hypothetical protein
VQRIPGSAQMDVKQGISEIPVKNRVTVTATPLVVIGQLAFA